ncbi:hypothetical protein KJ762_11055 [bacterium]|nr:hypothetical protein [bacterium]MBU1635030.1 hypothetical protein [bacterium]MBU1872351.1 hypothetical protein [bacterium]
MKTSYTPQLLIGLFLVFIGAILLIRDWWYLDQIFRAFSDLAGNTCFRDC